jgi:hypothetical protein
VTTPAEPKVPPPPVAFGIVAIVLGGALIVTLAELLAAPGASFAGLAPPFWAFVSVAAVTVGAARLLWKYAERRDFVNQTYLRALREGRPTLEADRQRLRAAGAYAELASLDQARPRHHTAEAPTSPGTAQESDSRTRVLGWIRQWFAVPVLAVLLAAAPSSATVIKEIKEEKQTPEGGEETNVSVYPKVSVYPSVYPKVSVYPSVYPKVSVYPTVKIPTTNVNVAEGANCVRFLYELDELLDDEPNIAHLLPRHAIPPDPNARSCGLTQPLTSNSSVARALSVR